VKKTADSEAVGCIFCLARSVWNENKMRMKKEMFGTPYSKLFKGGKILKK
jgi:hypothetical protein